MDNQEENVKTEKSTNSSLQNVVRLAAYSISFCVCLIGGLVVAIVMTTKSLLITMLKGKKDISKEIILITGGGSGLGRQIALDLARYRPAKVSDFIQTDTQTQTQIHTHIYI